MNHKATDNLSTKSFRKPPLILEDLFKKTAASPAIYWRPLTELDIQRRIELRNKVANNFLTSFTLSHVL